MSSDLNITRSINHIAGKHRKLDLAMDAYTRGGYLAFVCYGLWLWFGPAGRAERQKRRKSAVMALFSVIACSLISLAVGKLWPRKRPFVRDWHIWNFTGHKPNASFPSNHTMNSFAIVLQLYRDRMPGRHIMAALSGLLAFSRMFAGLHYPTDLLGGMGIAAAVNAVLNRSYLARGVAHLTAFFSLVFDRLIELTKIR
jgi:undecaprenyl-diphosphatase